MSDCFWYWCPEGLPDRLELDLQHYGYRGTAVVRREHGLFFTVVFRDTDIPEPYVSDVVYRIGQRMHSEYETSVPEDLRKMLFPVRADDFDDAVDTILRGINKINKCFFEVLKMNEYYDDIVYITDKGLEILDYFIGMLKENRETIGGNVDGRIAELSFKRSYLLSVKMHMIQ